MPTVEPEGLSDPEIFELTLGSYEGPFDDAADRERAVFYARCKLLEDIAYGVRTGARPYVATVRQARTLESLMRDQRVYSRRPTVFRHRGSAGGNEVSGLRTVRVRKWYAGGDRG